MRTPTLRRRGKATPAAVGRPSLGGTLESGPVDDQPQPQSWLGRVPAVPVAAGGAAVAIAAAALGWFVVAAGAALVTVVACAWLLHRARASRGLTGEDEAPRDVQEWTQGTSLATRATTTLLVAALLTGPAAALWLVLGGGRGATQHQPADPAEQVDLSARRGAAQNLATAWVRAWLTTPAAHAERLVRFWPDQVDLPAHRTPVQSVSVVDAVASAPGVWSVTVAADLAEPGAARRYFQVPVSVTGGKGTAGARVMALPAPVAGPGGAPDRVVTYPVQVARGAPLFAAVQAFVSALATGQGDITRYLSPGAGIRAINPPAYESAAVTDLSALRDVPGATIGSGAPHDKSVVRVLATVQLRVTRDPSSPALSTQYALTLTARAGRWEVTAIDPNPQTDQDTPAQPGQP